MNITTKKPAKKRDEFAQRVIDAIADFMDCPPEDISPSSKTVDDLQLDSLDAVTLHMHLEDEFDVQIPDEDFDDLPTVKDIIGLMRRKCGEDVE